MNILLNSHLYEYDIRGLLQAFFPWEKFSTDAPEAGEDYLSVLFSEGAGEGGTDRAEIAFRLGTFERRETLSVVLSDVKSAKGDLKRTLYRILSEATGRTLPWGTLTGIRPTKIASDLLNRGAGDEEILRHMEKDMLASGRKAALSLEIAKRERALLETLKRPGISLYVGVPFCPTTCLYCSFSSCTIGAYRSKVPAYLDAVSRELEEIKRLFPETPVHSVYFGGGTPTSLEPAELAMLLRKVEETFDLSETVEWTVEAGRPDSITVDKLRVMKKHAVNRISVNPQTFKQETLDLIGRHHTVEEVKEAFALARAEGFDNINMDLILGLPGETLADVERTYEEVKRCDPDSLTVHSLALKRASNMKAWVQEHGQISGLDYELAMNAGEAAAAYMNMQPYYLYRQKNMAGALENTGFAREGKYGLYNILIMEEVQSIYAIGAGTVSKKVYTDGSGRIERCDTHKDLSLYLSDIEAMIERKRKLFGEDK